MTEEKYLGTSTITTTPLFDLQLYGVYCQCCSHQTIPCCHSHCKHIEACLVHSGMRGDRISESNSSKLKCYVE